MFIQHSCCLNVLKDNDLAMNQPPVILFDGICNLCCGWVQFLIRKDKKMKFKFASIHSEKGQRMLHSIGKGNYGMETVIYLKGNQCFQKSSAVLEILSDLGGVWRLSGILKLIPKPILDEMYQYIAKKRYRYFGKRTSCFFPDPENQKRFLT